MNLESINQLLIEYKLIYKLKKTKERIILK